MQVRGAGHLYRPKYRAKGETAYRESGVWWWKCGRIRQSTGHRDEVGAQKWALERLIEMRRGHLVGVKAQALKYDDLERMLLDRWQLDGRRSLPQSKARLRFLRRAFSGWKAQEMTTDRLTAYALRRRQDGAAVGTINLELAILRRSFSLAREAGRLDVIPVVRRLPGGVHRTGTVEGGDLEAILGAMPARYHGAIRFLYWTGWREREALTLTWQHVDLAARELRLASENSKTGEPRVFSYGSIQPLVELLEQQRRGFGPYVFQGRGGRPIDRTALQKAWRRACVAVGLPAALIHDLRRTAVRDMRRAGVPLAVAMASVGHASLTVHQGYSVIAREDQNEGMSRLVALRAGEPIQRRLAAIE
jgi:integrase